jgi:hypothetical protein
VRRGGSQRAIGAATPVHGSSVGLARRSSRRRILDRLAAFRRSTRKRREPIYRTVAICRVCGSDVRADDLRPIHQGGGCLHCNGSPACSRCDHARRHHRGTFGGGQPRCTALMPVGTALAVGRCGCIGYTTDRSAATEAPTIVNVVELRLRTTNVPSTPIAPGPLAPVRDLFDSARRPHDSRSTRVPWRPPN